MSHKVKPKLEEIVTSLIQIIKDIDKEDIQSEPDARANLGELAHRVIHLRQNPAYFALEAKKADFERMSRENARLRARLELLESGNDADVTRAITSAINNANQIDKLSVKLEAARKREEKILESFRKTSLQYREVCYLLTGWRIDSLKDGIFRLSHMYAENEEDHLFFEISPDETIQLLENDYSNRLSEFIEAYLVNADSFPAFLASITLDLFKSTTQMAPSSMSMSMSMSMSTTIRPNPKFNF